MGVAFLKFFRFGWSQAGFQFEMGVPGDEDPNSNSVLMTSLVPSCRGWFLSLVAAFLVDVA
ncbi:hypothetical protein B7L70_02290 [Vulcanisaeta sp. EB80]|uniref:hypothetical protein n=1 Tax=Vulcanisaeta sp. EB80 TaxID=1650660 RepID=UPI0009BCD629|nr:hypothetical protein [Vulcanisaeta sp. EB80]PLC68701.1 hypothetical protein B7L70_02290 [Vulcanisaeta sp. EB80]